MKTIELLERALAINPSPKAWCDELKLNRTAINVARNRGRLSPVLAGNLAIKLGENPQQWIVIAALEAEQDSPSLRLLKSSLKDLKESEPNGNLLYWRCGINATENPKRSRKRFFFTCHLALNVGIDDWSITPDRWCIRFIEPPNHTPDRCLADLKNIGQECNGEHFRPVTVINALHIQGI